MILKSKADFDKLVGELVTQATYEVVEHGTLAGARDLAAQIRLAYEAALNEIDRVFPKPDYARPIVITARGPGEPFELFIRERLTDISQRLNSHDVYGALRLVDATLKFLAFAETEQQRAFGHEPITAADHRILPTPEQFADFVRKQGNEPSATFFADIIRIYRTLYIQKEQLHQAVDMADIDITHIRARSSPNELPSLLNHQLYSVGAMLHRILELIPDTGVYRAAFDAAMLPDEDTNRTQEVPKQT